MSKIYKYRTRWTDTIECFEVVKETPKQVVYLNHRRWSIGDSVLKEEREAKQSEYNNWHDTFEEAQDFLIAKSQSQIDSAKRQIDVARSNIDLVKKMKDPRPPEF